MHLGFEIKSTNLIKAASGTRNSMSCESIWNLQTVEQSVTKSVGIPGSSNQVLVGSSSETFF